MCSHGRCKRDWWLPTTFSSQEYVLMPGFHSQSTLEYIIENYMGLVAKLEKIFIPLLLGGHWYLTIVDLVYSRLIYLDSLKDPNQRAAQVSQMEDVDGLRNMGFPVDETLTPME